MGRCIGCRSALRGRLPGLCLSFRRRAHGRAVWSSIGAVGKAARAALGTQQASDVTAELTPLVSPAPPRMEHSVVSTVPALQRWGAVLPSDKGSHYSSSTAGEQGALCWGQESGHE